MRNLSLAALALCLALGACNTAEGIVKDVGVACELAGPVGSIVALPIPVAGAAIVGACAADAVAKAGITVIDPQK